MVNSSQQNLSSTLSCIIAKGIKHATKFHIGIGDWGECKVVQYQCWINKSFLALVPFVYEPEVYDSESSK